MIGSTQANIIVLLLFLFSGIVFETLMRYFYIMGKYEDALQCGQCSSEYLPAYKGFREEQDHYYIYSLTLLAVCKTSILLFSTESKQETTRAYQQRSAGSSKVCSLSISLEKCNEYMKIVAENQKKFKQYSDVAPMNYRHQFLLVEAELARVR